MDHIFFNSISPQPLSRGRARKEGGKKKKRCGEHWVGSLLDLPRRTHCKNERRRRWGKKKKKGKKRRNCGEHGSTLHRPSSSTSSSKAYYYDSACGERRGKGEEKRKEGGESCRGYYPTSSLYAGVQSDRGKRRKEKGHRAKALGHLPSSTPSYFLHRRRSEKRKGRRKERFKVRPKISFRYLLVADGRRIQKGEKKKGGGGRGEGEEKPRSVSSSSSSLRSSRVCWWERGEKEKDNDTFSHHPTAFF